MRLGGSVREGASVPTIAACANVLPDFTVLDAICRPRYFSSAKSEKGKRPQVPHGSCDLTASSHLTIKGLYPQGWAQQLWRCKTL